MFFKPAFLFSLLMLFEMGFASPRPLFTSSEASAEEAYTLSTMRPRQGRRDRNDPHVNGRNNRAMLRLFKEVVEEVNASVVEIRLGEDQIALGVVVDARGYILTKASQIAEGAVCVLGEGDEYPFLRVSVSEEHDLALLKIAADSLPAIDLEAHELFIRGNWLAVPGGDEKPLAVGIVGADLREIRGSRRSTSNRPYLGIGLGEDDNAAVVRSVSEGSDAEKAGLERGDRIVGIEDREIDSSEALMETLKDFEVGDIVTLSLRLEDDSIKQVEITLMHGNQANISSHNQIPGGLSNRRNGFPSVFQHDAIIEANECGGPVVNLEGEVVGLNIARAGRVKCYAIPTSIIKPLLEEWLAAEGQ